MPVVTLDDIKRAHHRIQGVALETPLLPALGLDVPDDNQLWLKAENLQRTASFKIRGAYNAVASLSDEERSRGVITYSSGNHGQAVACAACLLGVPAVIVMPEDAVQVKVDATRTWGARIEFAGHSSLDRQQRAMDLVEQFGYTVIPPFDDPRIIAGQGTAGVEILGQLPDVDAVLVPVGGGGLLAGVATAIKTSRPEIRVVGVEPEGGADARQSLETGRLVTWDRIDTVADGLRTSRVGELNFETIRAYVDDIVTVSDDEIIWTVQILAASRKLIVEPSGAAATAAAIRGRLGLHGKRIVSIISGGNVDPAKLATWLEQAIPRPVGVGRA